jgi:hypothetical protein
MPDLAYLSCGKPFPTQKQLSTHSSQCSQNNALGFTSAAFDTKKRRKSSKAGKKSKWTRIEWEEIIEQGIEADLNHNVQMEFEVDGDAFEQVILKIYCMSLTQCYKPDNLAGPSNILRSPSPPPPVTSKRSGRAVCMPRHFIDYLPGSATHLAHMPPTNWQQ